MALIVEDGSGLADAEAYVSVADATTYHTNMGNSAAWAAVGVTAVQEAMLRRATNYMRNRYYGMWEGSAVASTQRLDWPRSGVPTRDGGSAIASNIVPEDVKAACAELALKAFSADLMPDSSQAVKREKVGPLEVEYDEFSPSSPAYLAIDAMLAPFLLPGSQPGVNVPLMRV